MEKSLWSRGIGRLQRTVGQSLFESTAKRIRYTPPLSILGTSPVFLSMVCHRDVNAYLLALKSLYLRVGEGRVVVIDDGTLTVPDRTTLDRHIPGLEFVDIATIDTGTCPHGGCWERLAKVIELTATNYVIQMDADTLVSGQVAEVVRCWRDNRSFILGTDVGQVIAPAPASATLAQSWIDPSNLNPPSVIVQSEAWLNRLPNAGQRKYVHASAGFGGFARGAFRHADLEEFSGLMREMLGPRWDEWGSEQIASNYLLANAPDAVVLPFSRYACFEPHVSPLSDRPFLHFIGTYRYSQGVYRRRAKAFLGKQLKRSIF